VAALGHRAVVGSGVSLGLDIESLLDGSTGLLRERKGPCAVKGAL